MCSILAFSICLKGSPHLALKKRQTAFMSPSPLFRFPCPNVLLTIADFTFQLASRLPLRCHRGFTCILATHMLILLDLDATTATLSRDISLLEREQPSSEEESEACWTTSRLCHRPFKGMKMVRPGPSRLVFVASRVTFVAMKHQRCRKASET